VGALLDTEAGRHSDPCGEGINVAPGVPHGGNGVGIVPSSQQGARAGQKWLRRTADNNLTIAPRFESASA